MAEERPAWACQGQGPFDQDRTDGPRLLQQQRPYLHQLHAQADYGEHQLHREGPRQAHGDFGAEEAHNGGKRVVFSITTTLPQLSLIG